MIKEEWRPVSGFEDLYEVSDLGKIRSIKKGTTLCPSPVNKVGHLQVGLSRGGVRSSRYVHRLVLEAFTGRCPPGQQCRHLNGNAADNRLENLIWGTPSEDNYDRIRHGTHQNSKRNFCKYGHPYDRIKLYPDGTFHQRVCRTCTRRWNNVSKSRARGRV